jgi:hypothetical protein
MKLFPANEPLEFVSIDILGPLPKTVRGKRFLLVISDRFSKLTRSIPMRTTTSYSPQTNGQVERFNRTILNALRTFVAKSQTDWDDYTAAITFGYNSRVHASLGFAPFELVLSRPPSSLSAQHPIWNPAEVPVDEKRRVVQRFKELIPLAKDRILEAQRRYKENFDRHARVANQWLSADSWVFLRR